jgi:2-pyrone-4,6-dicarboxylate lactonase
VDASAGLEHSAFRTLLSLVARDERCWVKITGLERLSRRPAVPRRDTIRTALVETARNRVLWGTDGLIRM